MNLPGIVNMSLWLDDKYVRLASPFLDQFRQKSLHNYNFRCPLCGDSERNRLKARGYVYPKGDDLMFKCHNCALALPFSALLRRISRPLHDEYVMERFRDSPPVEKPSGALWSLPMRFDEQAQRFQPKATTFVDAEVPSVVSVADMPGTEVYRFCTARSLPVEALRRLFYTEQARSWLLTQVPEEKADKINDGVPFLIQPLRLPDGTWYGAQLRNLKHKAFYNFRWSHESWKIFGLEAWSADALTYLVEGPIDSLFIPNSLSATGSDLMGAWHQLSRSGILTPSTPCVFVWDNEPRNGAITHMMRVAIGTHQPIVIWPIGFPHKDINDAITAGVDVLSLLARRTFSGLTADLEFSAWVKK